MVISTERICNHTFLPGLLSSASNVIDLGANRGEFSLGIIRRFGCRVFSAEPIRELCDRVPPHSLLQLHNVAVGGKNQDVVMNVYSGQSECASILDPVNKAAVTTARTIPMITFPEFRRIASAERVDLLKVDIEGAEIDLFASCDDSEMRSVTQITVEFHDFMHPSLHDSVVRICERMATIGFWVVPFSLDNSDVLFVNQSARISPAQIAYLRRVVKYSRGLHRRLTRSAQNMGLLARKN